MPSFVVRRRHTGWDIVLGILLVVGGLVILSDTVWATVVSVLLLGWLALLSGIVALVAALLRLGWPGFWPPLLTGGVLTVLGLMFLRHPDVAALTLTLIAGSLFFVSGVVRIVAAFHDRAYRWPLLLGGAASTVLGLIVLLDIIDASLTLLGILLGVQTLVDGVTLLMFGRLHATAVPSDDEAMSTPGR